MLDCSARQDVTGTEMRNSHQTSEELQGIIKELSLLRLGVILAILECLEIGMLCVAVNTS